MNRLWGMALAVLLALGTAGESGLTPAAAASDVTAVDLKSWKHPIRKVFADFGVTLKGVELLQNRTYPKFTVQLPYKLSDQKERDFDVLVSELAGANGYWPFEMVDDAQAVTVQAKTDRKLKLVTRVLVNGKANYFDRAFDAYLAGIRKLEQLDIVAQGDLDGDRKIEYIVRDEPDDYGDGVSLHVVQRSGATFVNAGRLKDEVGVAHELGDIEFAPMDRTGKLYIVAEMLGPVGGVGFNLYRWDAGCPVLIQSNFPHATGMGYRYLKDVDNDGVMDNVSEYAHGDFQGHVILLYKRFDGAGTEKHKIEFSGVNGRFRYPAKAEDVIRTFIEDCYWDEILLAERKQLVASDAVLKFKIRDYVYLGMMDYGGIDLAFKTASAKNGTKTIVVTTDAADGKEQRLQFAMTTVNGLWKINSIKAL
ncbi:hypothetical protein ACFFSY_25495 [Paenibacillus aurantiacus]|uniref:VCBS repeat-containing protein n=1 Tax=Paenibacillus aurantiacus TaxID=1936118 RepID=A0ABV5KVP4_9BACL